MEAVDCPMDGFEPPIGRLDGLMDGLNQPMERSMEGLDWRDGLNGLLDGLDLRGGYHWNSLGDGVESRLVTDGVESRLEVTDGLFLATFRRSFVCVYFFC